MVETLIKKFNQISKTDAEIAGGKGSSLGEMIRAGIPVPDGFVILSNVFDRFIEETDLNVEIDAILDSVDVNEVYTVENASKEIQGSILSKEMPEDIKVEILEFYKNLDCKFVAVRSSATSEDSASAAWAGQLDSFLNTTQKTLLENVKKCWASLFTPRAVFYRFEKELQKQKISVAVVVQKMVASKESGIAFSVHPVTQDENQIIIEAGFGLGEAIVSGSITPDSYVVDKQGFSILDINVNEQTKALYRKTKSGNEWKELGDKGKKQVLTEKEIIELSKLIIKIEKHYGFPCDIEWAKEKGKFYIVQSRPITTLRNIKLTKKPIYAQVLSHDFPLMIAELTNYGESMKEIPWSKNKFKIFPYCVFEKKDGILKYYYDTNGVDWKIKEAGKFNKEKMKREILLRYKEIEEILLKKPALNRKNFLNFLKKLKQNWTWWDCMWWMIEYYDKHKLPLEDLIEIRKRTEHMAHGISGTIRNSLKKIFPKKEKYIDAISIKDIEENKLPNDKILKRRLKYFVYTNNKFYNSLKDIEKEFDIKFKIENVKEKTELIGQVAYHGRVRGKVRIVETKEDVMNFRKGEIIVSSTTTPDFLSAMKKSSAILSEHGGVICHASITSRELKIPCVIGIKGVTRALKTGDEIEVDANEGIIRILKKKNKEFSLKKFTP
ncbi:MAG TPA: hypothetical protein DCS28_03110 [Candidatus Moranbacteria bacterium]|nr:hypothetical protein [Candidatus Moranbacteria bacterium]HAT75001.1 hypothetical protein [Candidatus Moranbacteria bacterium]